MYKYNNGINLDPEYLEQEADRILGGGKPSRQAKETVNKPERAATTGRTVARNTNAIPMPEQRTVRNQAPVKPMPVNTAPIDDDDDDDEISAEEFQAMMARKAAKQQAAKRVAPKEEYSSEYRPRRTAGNTARTAANPSKPVKKNPQPKQETYYKEDDWSLELGENYEEERPVRRNTTKKNNKKKKPPVFWIGFGIWVVILLIFSVVFLSYTDKCLKKYEAAQSNNAMKEYMKEFKAMVDDKTIADKAVLKQGTGAFESEDVHKELYLKQFEGATGYTFEKDPGSYMTEEPVYDVYAGENMVAKVTLSAKNERTIFAILTIMDWEVKSIEAVYTVTENNYTINVPSNYTVSVNGITLTDENKTGDSTTNPEFVNVNEYYKMPEVVEYKVEKLINQPEIKILDENGAEVTYTLEGENGKYAINLGLPKPQEVVPEEYYDDALKMAKAWEDFLTADLDGANHGLETIRQYLIKDSYYWEMATDYAYGVDITFISDHTLLDPAYSNVKLTDFVSYGEDCYSCHIYFEKNMKLTRTGETRVDIIDSKFYFVNYDDTDDGVDNPHWAIVDMIAATE